MNGLSFIQKVIEMLRQLFLLQLFVPYRHIPGLSESALKVAPDCHEKEEAENEGKSDSISERYLKISKPLCDKLLPQQTVLNTNNVEKSDERVHQKHTD